MRQTTHQLSWSRGKEYTSLNRKKVQMLSEQTDRAECSVSGSMSWMFRMSQLAGVAPVRFDGRRISVSETLFYVHCVFMTAMILILILYFGYEATYMLVFVVQMQFLITTLEVYEAFKGLNDALDGVSPQNSLQSVAANQIWPKSAEETIRHLASEFNNLCLVMKRLEKAFGCSVILLLLSCLLHMVIIANYTSYHIMGKQMIGGYSAPLPLKLTWCVLHFLRTVFIIEPSHHTRVEMDRTNLLVSQLILQNNDYMVSEELERFYRYIVLNKTSYTPMGICTLNRPLLASILSSVVTYLVISVQFQILEASENS
ncbi:hypothetical protein ABMA27_008314 [Loxostege sticticalis]|uniref:Gustatory receptor n=1 Tax=Loxostege sticticalis TaxID=481309 RepID=A0ABR3HB91_LOXSC